MQISQNMVSWPLSWLSHKIKPSVDFVQNMSKICWDIDQNVLFNWVVASHFDCLKIIYSSSWRFSATPSRIHWVIDQNVQF